ncbi:MAG: ATP-binding protein [Limnothrix sp.]
MISSSDESKNLAPIHDLTEEQRQALLNVVYRIRASLNVQDVLSTTALEIRQLLEADRVGIFWFHPDADYRTGEFVAESVVKGYPSAIANPVKDNCFGKEYAEGYKNGRIQAVGDIYNAGLSDCHIDVLAQFQIRANLIVPLRIKNVLWGLFCVHQCSATREWQAQEVEFIRHLGSHLDIALQQGELLNHTIQQSSKLRLLTQERDRFFSLSPNLFCVANFDGKLLRVNPAWEDILGYMQDELIKGDFWTFVHPEDEAITREALSQLVNHGEVLNLEHRFRCANGTYKHLSWSGTAVKKEKHIYAIARDITKRKQLEFELSQRSTELEQALRKLKQTQTQLVQNAKMSSLGQLVAGIAHEINNPTNFIYGNIIHVNSYVTSLQRILDAYQVALPDPPAQITELCEEEDLEFILADLPDVMKSIQIGTDRIKDIVLSLRNFSRTDEVQWQFADVHECIDNTILILQNRIKGTADQTNITIQRNYGDLPKIDCYPGRLSQVFMNILSNAIDAIADSKKASKGIITITSKVLAAENHVVIRIRDNGQGMDDETNQQIFDPFFTTKDVGKGTGLGMSISYQIVTDHHSGSLVCKSEQGVGTEFIIKLPCTQSPT